VYKKEFTPDEFAPFALLLVLVVIIVVVNYSRGYKEFWSPLTIIAIVYAYYCCLGPYEAVLTGDTLDRLLNMRKFYPSAFWGALVSLLSYVLGFSLYGSSTPTRKIPTFSNEVLFEYGRKIFLIGFVLFTISVRGRVTSLINPLDAEYVPKASGSFANYFALSLNFIIPGITLLFTYFLLTRKKLLWFIIPFIIGIGLFTTLGFRYRIVLLLCSLGVVFYFVRQKRPNLIVLAFGLVALIAVMGVINMSRRYGAGLNVQKLQNTTSESAYQSGLQEASIFQTSGAIIDIVPNRHPYAGFQPIVSTLLFPIPSKLLPDKNSAQYLFEALDAVYGKELSKGSAIMAYGEYYLAFGWFGIVIGCLITGWYLRKLWNWFLFNSNNPFAMAIYAVTVSFIYMVLSRGYLPQVTNLFFFTVFPIYLALRYARKKYGAISKQWR
jgi:oligosaccharide repeat unit polymerase